MTVSIRVRYAKAGGHIHARVFCSEFGPETSHGLSGTLTFRHSEWPAFRAALLVGLRPDAGRFYLGDDEDRVVVEFIDETDAIEPVPSTVEGFGIQGREQGPVAVQRPGSGAN